MENFEQEMDEAYFPEGVSIITYRTTIQTFMDPNKDRNLILARNNNQLGSEISKDYEMRINKAIGEIPEHIVILKCIYRD